MKKDDLLYVTTAVKNLAPGASFTSNLTDNIITEWLSPDIAQPSQSQIDSEMTRLEGIFNVQEYSRNRKLEYDALNQFELISDDAINGTTTHEDAIVAIKTKWPKDNSGPIE